MRCKSGSGSGREVVRASLLGRGVGCASIATTLIGGDGGMGCRLGTESVRVTERGSWSLLSAGLVQRFRNTFGTQVRFHEEPSPETTPPGVPRRPGPGRSISRPFRHDRQ